MGLQQLKDEWKKEQLMEEEKISKGKQDLNEIENSFILIEEKMMSAENSKDVLELNIGGTELIATHRSTLTKFPSSTLGWMFSGKHDLKSHND